MRVKLSDICDIYDGPHATPKPTDAGPIFLGIKNINEYNQLDLADVVHLSPNDFEKWTKRVTPMVDDIVFSYEATLNRYALIPDGFYGCLGRRLAIARVKDKEKVNPHYLYHYFCSPFWNRFILANKVIGSTVLRVSIEDFPNYEVELPDIDTQNKICGLLDDITEKIENNKTICANLESMAKLLYDYWFVQFDFPDENGRPYKSSGGKMIWDEELEQKIPDEWKSVPLSSVFEFEKGRIPNYTETTPTTECDTPYLTIDVVNVGTPSFCSSQNMILANGEVLMVMDGAASSDVYAGYNGAIGSTFAKCTIKNKSMSNQLLYVILRRYNNVFAKVNTGSTVPHANKDYILNFRIPLPNCAKLKDLSEKFVSILSLVYAAREENRELTSFRDFLLPMLMNGQVKIKDSESGAERNAET